MADYSQQTIIDFGKTIQDMLNRFGPDIARDEKRFKSVALDFIPDLPVVNLLVLALGAGVPQELQAPVGSTPKPLVIGRIITRLQQSHNLNESGARLAVLAWAQALGILDPVEVASFFQPNVFSSLPDQAPSQEYSVTTIQVQGVKFDFCWIPPGKFQMGDDYNLRTKPVHEVEITRGFWLGRTPVTQGQWKTIMGDNPAEFKKGDAYPVGKVGWENIQRFVKRMKIFADKIFRLPTEAEWEYACRAGTTGKHYGPLDEIAWYADNTNDSTEEVAQLKPNAWGLYDMLGNVWEICQDWYSVKYYATSPIQDPTGPANDSNEFAVEFPNGTTEYMPLPPETRVIRGGSYGHDAFQITAASRAFYIPNDFKQTALGFRLVMEH